MAIKVYFQYVFSENKKEKSPATFQVAGCFFYKKQLNLQLALK